MKKKILLITSFLRSSPKTIDEALAVAKQKNAELVAFFVLDVQYADRIATILTDEGWMGKKPSEQLYLSLLKEYRLQAESKLAEMAKRAELEGVPFRAIIKSGKIVTETLSIARHEEPDLIIITRRKRSNLSRLIFGSVSKALHKKAKCKVRIVESE
jgi:nucleotide-binding universal stress UspA family protein